MPDVLKPLARSLINNSTSSGQEDSKITTSPLIHPALETLIAYESWKTFFKDGEYSSVG